MAAPKPTYLDTSAATMPGTGTPPSGTGTFSGGPEDLQSLPERIGRYRVTRLIGMGGMGAVYEAEQEQPRRTVALKVVRGAAASAVALRRFEYESELLARLRHPGIAQVFEAGTHTEGFTRETVPYFAMEFIPDAKTLTVYADVVAMKTGERLRLFAQVCDAVQHAHQRAVIHRDLKPANILVDSSGQPKIIDFGVARASDAGAQVTQNTTAGQLVGTLQYMSPEQCTGELGEVDARADVHALGVILFELLTGQLPYDLSGRPFGDAIRMIREAPPKRPSIIRRELAGDLETIALKALEKEPAKRYESAAALAGDINRYLKSEPILARPIGPVGRLSRWVRRNRAVATAVAASAAGLLIVSVVLVSRIVLESRRANQNLIVAKDNLNAAKENFELIKGLFGSMQTDELTRGLVNVEQILDLASQRLKTSPPEQEATEADFREILAVGYRNLQVYAKSIEHQRRVVQIREKMYPNATPQMADALHHLAAALWLNGQYEEAGRLYSRSLEMRRIVLPPDHPEIATSLTHLAACRLKQGLLSEAESLYTTALNMRRKLAGDKSPEIAASLNNLAKCLAQRGDFEGAEKLFRQAYAMITELRGEDSAETANAAHNLALHLLMVGKAEEGSALFAQAFRIRSAKMLATNPLVSASRLGLARAEFTIRPNSESLEEARRALESLEGGLKPDHPDIAEAYGRVGIMYLRLDRYADAEPLLRRSLAIHQKSSEATSRDIAIAEYRLAEGLALLGNFDEAERLIIDSAKALEGVEGAAHLQCELDRVSDVLAAAMQQHQQ